MVELQELLGHASLETTRRYLSATGQGLRDVIQAHPNQAALRVPPAATTPMGHPHRPGRRTWPAGRKRPAWTKGLNLAGRPERRERWRRSHPGRRPRSQGRRRLGASRVEVCPSGHAAAD